MLKWRRNIWQLYRQLATSQRKCASSSITRIFHLKSIRWNDNLTSPSSSPSFSTRYYFLSRQSLLHSSK